MRCIVKPSGLNKIRSRGHYRAEKRNCKPAAGKCNRECRRYPCALVGQIFGELRQVGVSSYPPDIVMTSEKFPCVDSHPLGRQYDVFGFEVRREYLTSVQKLRRAKRLNAKEHHEKRNRHDP